MVWLIWEFACFFSFIFTSNFWTQVFHHSIFRDFDSSFKPFVILPASHSLCFQMSVWCPSAECWKVPPCWNAIGRTHTQPQQHTHTQHIIVAIITNDQFLKGKLVSYSKWNDEAQFWPFSRSSHGSIMQFIVYIALLIHSYCFSYRDLGTGSQTAATVLWMQRKSIRQFLCSWTGLDWAITVHRWWVAATL